MSAARRFAPGAVGAKPATEVGAALLIVTS